MAGSGGQVVPSLTLEMLRVVSGSNTVLVRSDHAGVQNASVPGFVIPTDRNGQLWIHFAPTIRHATCRPPTCSRGRFLLTGFARRLVADRNVGGRAARFQDDPIDPVMPGVEVHAQVARETCSPSPVLSSPNYAIGVELCRGAFARHRHHLADADLESGSSADLRRRHRHRHRGHFMVLLPAETACCLISPILCCRAPSSISRWCSATI